MLGKIKTKIIRLVRKQCIQFMHQGQFNSARVLLSAVLGRKTDVLLVHTRNLGSGFPKHDYLWRNTYHTSVYNTLGETVGEVPIEGWIKELEGCFIHHGTSAVLDRSQQIAYIDMAEGEHPNHDHAFGVMEFYSQGKGIIVTKKNSSTINKGIYIGGNASFNYYHFVVEIATRFFFLNNLKSHSDYPLLIDEVIMNTRQFREIINILNKDQREIIVIKDKVKYCVEKLVIISNGATMAINVFDKSKCSFYDTIVCHEALHFVRQSVLAKIGLTAENNPPVNKLFVTRKGGFTRRGCNEDELWNVATKYSYTKIAPETMSFTEQVTTFHGCKSLLANSGAALTNILFMQQGTTAVYWLNGELKYFTAFNYLAKTAGCDLFRINGTPKNNDKADLHSYYYVDPRELEVRLA